MSGAGRRMVACWWAGVMVESTATSHQPPATSHQPPATMHQSPAT
ncbi:hypothetical protein [Streptomyces anulatus]|nr:hypothetical protein OG391_33695 [Streptomyces anulatus]